MKDRTILASGSDDGTIKLWKIGDIDFELLKYTGTPINLPKYGLPAHRCWVGSLALSPDEETLASASYDQTIKLWDLRQIDWDSGQFYGKPIVLNGQHDQSITSVTFSSDGIILASGSYDNTLRLWIARTEDLADMVCEKVFGNLTVEEWKEYMGEDIEYILTCPPTSLPEKGESVEE